MKQEIKYAICFLIGALSCFLIMRYISKPIDDIELINLNTVSEQKIRLLNEQLLKNQRASDSLQNKVAIYEEKINSQKNNTDKVKEKHEAVRNNLFLLSDDEQIEYLSKRLSQ